LPGYPCACIFAAVRIRPKFLGIAVAAALSAASARGEEPIPAGIPDLVGARALALSAYRGLAAGNDGIFTNAASLAARRRYAVEGQWILDRARGAAAFQAFGTSVVDSETSSLTGGFAWTRVLSGPWQGNLFHVPFAFPVSNGFFLGGTAKYASLDGPGRDVGALTLDASAFWQLSSLVSIGGAGYNLIHTGHAAVLPRAVGAGVALGDPRRFQVTGDWRGDFDRDPNGKTTNLYAAGAELLLGDLLPVRGGYLRDETRHASYWSAGVGFVTSSGFAVDASFRQGIDDSDDRTFAIGVKLFVLGQ
jgi:hypothetical protein